MISKKFLSVFSLFLLLGASAVSHAKDLPVVSHVDLTRYQGKWYEIASIPQWFQRQCVKNTSAEYELLPSGEVKVYNSCETKTGERDASEGRARVEDTDTNAKLKVTFANVAGKYIYLFGGKYWIINLDPNYEYVVVGHPNRDYGWILARNPSLPIEKVRELAQFLKAQGYDICKFMTSPQDGGTFHEKNSFCRKK